MFIQLLFHSRPSLLRRLYKAEHALPWLMISQKAGLLPLKISTKPKSCTLNFHFK